MTDNNVPLPSIKNARESGWADGYRRGQAVRRRVGAGLLILILAALAGFGGGWLGAKYFNHNNGTSTADRQQVVLSESKLISSIAKDVGQSVVSVNVVGTAVQANYFGLPQSQVSEGAGTGIILTKEGIVMTNRHVVPEGTTGVSVTLSDGTKLDDVEVIGRTVSGDPLDVAFLRIKDLKGKTLVPAIIGDSASMQVGDKVIAIGNALGQFQNTVTSGIISGYGRTIEASSDGTSLNSETLQDLFQIDAAINPGNSGGPLVNVNSEVVGMNVATASAENINFSIPINDLKGLIDGIIQKGKLERTYLGVRYVLLNDDYAYTFNLSVKRGAYITSSGTGQPAIVQDSPADKAGLKEKDIITSVDGKPIDENNSLISVLGRHKVGDKVKLKIIRDGKEIFADVTLEAAPGA